MRGDGGRHRGAVVVGTFPQRREFFHAMAARGCGISLKASGHGSCSTRGMSHTATVNGPELSRRFGRMLRLNLSTGTDPRCNFACAYCRSATPVLPARSSWMAEREVLSAIDSALDTHVDIDCIAISGNGEPTLHPGFAPIVEGLVRIRAGRAPGTKLAIVSNGSTLDRIEVRRALSQLDQRIMKLDAGDATTFRTINGACLPLGRLISGLRFLGEIDLLSRFVRNDDRTIDNTCPAALEAWLSVVRTIRPRAVQVCGWEWPSRAARLSDVPVDELASIAARVQSIGIPATVYA